MQDKESGYFNRHFSSCDWKVDDFNIYNIEHLLTLMRWEDKNIYHLHVAWQKQKHITFSSVFFLTLKQDQCKNS